MKYLLDTHVVLWLFEGSEKLSKKAQEIIFNDESEVYVSIISAWEVAIKVSLNKLDFAGGSELLLASINDYDMKMLGIKGDYITTVEKLPYIHRDPFDRLLVSTAMVDDLIVVSSDENIQKYGVPWVW